MLVKRRENKCNSGDVVDASVILFCPRCAVDWHEQLCGEPERERHAIVLFGFIEQAPVVRGCPSRTLPPPTAQSSPLFINSYTPPPPCGTARLQASGDLTKLRLWEQMQVLGAASRERGSYLAIFKVMGLAFSCVASSEVKVAHMVR